MIGTSTPCIASRSTMRGTAAADSGLLTVTRTSSEPARQSSATCLAVAATSAVSVLVINCTTTGACPPTATPPILTWRVALRGIGPNPTGPVSAARAGCGCADIRIFYQARGGRRLSRRGTEAGLPCARAGRVAPTALFPAARRGGVVGRARPRRYAAPMNDPSNGEVLTPSQLNTLARSLLEDAFPLVLVEGELGNVARPSSGHLYF